MPAACAQHTDDALIRCHLPRYVPLHSETDSIHWQANACMTASSGSRPHKKEGSRD